jgi:hypothetical protein
MVRSHATICQRWSSEKRAYAGMSRKGWPRVSSQ